VLQTGKIKNPASKQQDRVDLSALAVFGNGTETPGARKLV
jgi:hypothetical protein